MTEGQSPTPEARRSTLSLMLPPLVTTLLFAAILLALHLTGVLALVWEKESLQERVRSAGAWAPIAYIGIIVVRPFTLFPSVLLAPIAYALFGWTYGTALKVCGETIGSTLAFLTARYGFRRTFSGVLRRLVPGVARSMDGGFVYRLGRVLERRSGRAVLALRLNLLVPFDALNWGLGLTRLRAVPYVAGTFAGIIPGAFLYIGLAGSALEGDWLKIALTAAGIAAMIWLSVPLAREVLSSSNGSDSGADRTSRGPESPGAADRAS